MKGFYVLQLENNDIKIETISYLDTIDKFTPVLKAVYLCESITDVIRKSPYQSVDHITNKIMHMSEFNSFTTTEINNIRNLIIDMVTDYLR